MRRSLTFLALITLACGGRSGLEINALQSAVPDAGARISSPDASLDPGPDASIPVSVDAGLDGFASATDVRAFPVDTGTATDVRAFPVDTGTATDALEESDAPDASGPACVTSSDCASGTQCLFAVGDCSAQGQCLAPFALGPICNSIVSYCGCDGETVAGLCGPDYAYGPTLGIDGPCGPPVVVTPGATLTTLAVQTQTLPVFLAVDANNVYWTAAGDGTVLEVPVDGGAVVTLAFDQAAPSGIAVDAANVYWANNGFGPTGSVAKVPIGGGTVTTLASSQGTPYEVAIDATRVFWTNLAADAGVMQVPIAGGAATVLAAAAESQAIAVQGANVYYTEGDNVLTVGVNGGAPVTLASGQAYPYSLAVDATSVYWSNVRPPNPALLKAPIGGGTPVTLTSGTPMSIAVDGTNVYFTSPGTVPNDAQVMSVPIGGGTPTTLVNGQSGAQGIAVYGKNVYWVDTTLGAVMKLTLP